MTLGVSTWLFLLCVVGPVLTFKHKGSTMDNSPTAATLLSISKIGAALFATIFLLVMLLLVVALFTPAHTPASWTSLSKTDVDTLGQKRMLQGVTIIVLLSLPLQLPGFLLACDILRTPAAFVSWGYFADIWCFRLTTLVPLFWVLYSATATSGPTRCSTEDQMYQQKYVIGSDVFYYDRRAAPPPSVAAGMRVAYWRVAQYEKIDVIIEGIKKREMFMQTSQWRCKLQS